MSLELNAAQGYTICLQRAREHCQTRPELSSNIVSGIRNLIWSYIDPLTNSGSNADIRLVRFSAEALLTFQTFLSPQPNSSATPSTKSDKLISSKTLIDTIVDVLLMLHPWKLTFKACIIRILLWIWRNHLNRGPEYYWERFKLFTSSCRLWAALEKEVNLSKTGDIDGEGKPLTSEDLKCVLEFAEWVRTQTLGQWYTENFEIRAIRKSAFIVRGADVGINRLYAHFDRHANWEYRLYDHRGDSGRCSRSVYKVDGMP